MAMQDLWTMVPFSQVTDGYASLIMRKNA